MTSNVVELDSTKVSTVLAEALGGTDSNDDLSAGVSGGFSVISFRGSKWRVKHGGEETLIVDSENEALASIRVVLLKANKHISKNYYGETYKEGSTDAPICWSVDGVKPDAGVEKPQSETCAGCPNNVFGSRITENNTKAKACSDSRRVAVVAEGDWANEAYGGGPMLLRVPPASLSDLASFGKAMTAKGFPYNTIVTKVGFDPDTAYPKLKFSAARPLTEEEGLELIALLGDPEYTQKLDFVLAEAAEIKIPEEEKKPEPKPEPDDPTAFEDEQKPAKPAATKKAEAKKPEPEPTAEGPNDDELDSILAKLDDLD